MKHIFISTLLILICLTLFAQNPHRPGYLSETSKQEIDTPEAKVEYALSRIDLVGFQFEKSFNKRGTLVLGLYSNFLFPYIIYGDPHLTYGFLPKIELSFRDYYSLQKRKRINKPYQNNTGPYITGKFEFQKLLASFEDGFDDYTTTSVGLLWGFQNNSIQPITINFEIGPGYAFADIDAPNYNFEGPDFVILGKLKFGFLLDM